MRNSEWGSERCGYGYKKNLVGFVTVVKEVLPISGGLAPKAGTEVCAGGLVVPRDRRLGSSKARWGAPAKSELVAGAVRKST